MKISGLYSFVLCFSVVRARAGKRDWSCLPFHEAKSFRRDRWVTTTKLVFLYSMDEVSSLGLLSLNMYLFCIGHEAIAPLLVYLICLSLALQVREKGAKDEANRAQAELERVQKALATAETALEEKSSTAAKLNREVSKWARVLMFGFRLFAGNT